MQLASRVLPYMLLTWIYSLNILSVPPKYFQERLSAKSEVNVEYSQVWLNTKKKKM